MSFFPQSFGLFGYGGYGMPWSGVAQLPPADLPQVTPTEPAEQNEPIDRSQNAFLGVGARGWFPGFDKAPPPGIPTWWLMRRYATVVLAYSIVTAPILAGQQTVEVVNDGDTEAEDWKADAEKALLPPLVEALPAALECLQFGPWLQEIVWAEKDGLLCPEFHPLLPGEAVLYRDRYRRFAGYKVGAEERDARYGFLAVNEPHLDPIFGYSRNENCREEWWRSRKSEENADRVENKASGIQMMIGVPMGMTFTGDDGKPILAKDAAQVIVNAAVQGQTFTVPLTPFRKDDIKRDPKLADIPAVKVDAFDWKDNAPTLLAHLARLERLDKQIMRAWHRPEREAMEGQHGTKAEAGTHGAIGTTDSELVAAMVLRQYDRQVTNRWLVTKYGPDAIDRLSVRQAPLSDPQQEFYQSLTKVLAQDTATGPTMVTNIDQRQLLDKCEIPLLSEEDAAKAQADAEAKQAAKDKAKADALAQNVNGNGNQNVPVKIAASGNGHEIGAVDLYNRLMELGRDE